MDDARPRDDARDEALFDEFLERALAGEIADPAAFCADKGLGEPPSWLLELGNLVDRSAPVQPPPAAGSADAPERRIGDYVLVRHLGEGGMGVVYLAEDRALHRHVALKVIRPELAGSPTAMQRFEREARALARLRHPGIAAVHAYGEADGVRYLAMELVLGRDLDEVLAGGSLPVLQAVRIARDLGEALAAAHKAGVLHRDVKPANVRLAAEDRAMLMDFGLARQLNGEDPTLTKAFAGSPAYAAPEQLTGAREVDERTDVYGLGATLYELLVGQVPFAGDSVDQIMRRVLTEDPVAPRRLRPDVPRDLEAVVLQALDRDPDRRYQTATEFAADLEAVLAGRSVQATPPGLVRRTRGWMRRHRLAAAGIALVLFALFAGGLGLGVQTYWSRSENRAEARQLVTKAREALAEHADARATAVRARNKLRALDARLVERPLNDGEERARARFTRESTLAVRQRDEVFATVVSDLRRAQGLDSNSELLQRAWAEMHYHQWLDLRQTNPAAAALHFDRVSELDADGDLAAKVQGVQRVSLSSNPAGAEVHLFRWREHRDVVAGGESRLVPVGPADSAPRGPVLRVECDGGGLLCGDLITAVEGHAVDAWMVRSSDADAVSTGALWVGVDSGPPQKPPLLGKGEGEGEGEGELEFVFATGEQRVNLRAVSLAALGLTVQPAWQVLRRGDEIPPVRLDVLRGEELLVLDVRPPIDVVPTYTAFVLTPATRIGVTPMAELVLEPGSYLAVLRAPGHQDCRVPFHVDHAVETYSRPRGYEINLTRHAVPGLTYVPAQAYGMHDFFLQQTEVTNGVYLEFVNQRKRPERWLPGHLDKDEARPKWRIVDGRAVLPDGVDPELPVTGVSWRSAQRFARWYPAALGLDTDHWYGVLPQFGHFARAAHGGDDRVYVHGNYFNPKWIKSRHSKRTIGLEPTLSYPLDESPFGIFDLQGSVAEWAGDLTNPISEGTRIIFGGSWADATPFRFLLRSYRTVPPDAGQGWVGFRVMLLERDDG